MVFKNNFKSFIIVILLGIFCGVLCASLDLIPSNNLWTFASFSGSLGFWAISATLILMQSDNIKLAAINTFLYFGFMNSSFFFTHLLLPLEYPRISTLGQAASQSLIWLIPSLICVVFALVVYQSKNDNKLGTFTLSLPLGVLLYEEISLIFSVIINHKYLFQTIVDLVGIILLFMLYKGKKNMLHLILYVIIFALLLISYSFIKNDTIMYY